MGKNTLFGAFAQLERDYLKDRQMEGISIAVTAGKYKGRKPIKYPKLWEKYYRMMQDGDISGVDDNNVANSVINTLEGGSIAFNMRKEKYNF